MNDRYRAAIVPDPPAPFVVCTDCVTAVGDTDEDRALHDIYHEQFKGLTPARH